MKSSLLLFLITVIHVSASVITHGQNLTMTAENQTVREVFRQIETETNYRFFYNEEFSDLSKAVSFEVNNNHINDVMDIMLSSSNVTYRILENDLVVITPNLVESQEITITGRVTDADTGEGLPGTSVIVRGTTIGTIADIDGEYTLTVPGPDAVLVFSFVGYLSQEIVVGEQTLLNVTLSEDVLGLEEVVVVGYGTQRKSDITGSIASISDDRLRNLPNINLSQALQGSIPGVTILQTSAGANPGTSFMIRGRNSIRASNAPLVIVDGIPGSLGTVNPNDVESVEVLKDASAAAIYGSRGANGVVLITTKLGREEKPTLSYDGYYSMQKLYSLPHIMNASEFYNFKKIRDPGAIKEWDTEKYETGGVYWPDLVFQTGLAHQHSLSVSGRTANTSYYISGGYYDIEGITLNDKNSRITSRINVDTQITDWLKFGTRTQLAYNDRSGVPASAGGAFNRSPLAEAYDSDGNLTIFPISYEPNHDNPLSPILYEDKNIGFSVFANNFLEVDFPFISGLKYTLNTGVNIGQSDQARYMRRNTMAGYVAGGRSSTNKSESRRYLFDNIVSYNNEIGNHGISSTLLYSVETYEGTGNSVTASRFPSDLLMWYATDQAEEYVPGYSYSDNSLLSQMIRLNYSYNNKYLVTLTTRRDGFSGFGAETKWGVFPSFALGWNIHNEDFFPWSNFISELKLRGSYGLNGNQAVGSYETIARLSPENMVARKQPVAGYKPHTLAQDDLGWESSTTINVGLDFGFLANRITGDVNFYKAHTTDLLLNRTISHVHGITSITQNIGETENLGFEFSLNSVNISRSDFTWRTIGSLSTNKNQILSLYGELDEEGREIDDVANAWFIGHPIRVNYAHKWIGTWQLDEADEAEKYGQQPGFVKVEDVDDNDVIDADDRQILGQMDPKVLWGLTNTFSFKNFTLNIFVHGVHGVTRINALKTDHAQAEVKINRIQRDWWTPDNPTNDWIVNHYDAEYQGGVPMRVYENAGFVRVKDISLGYDLPLNLIERLGVNQLRIYLTGRNLFTFTEFEGLDPELSGARSIPIEREYVFGLNIGF